MKLCILVLALAASALAQAPAPTGIAPDTIVVRVDGKDVTAREISEELRNMPPDFQEFYKQNPAYAVQQMYIMRYLARLAEDAKLGENSPLKEQLAVARQNLMATAMLSHEQNSYDPPRDAIQSHYEKNRASYQTAKVRIVKIAFKPVVGASTPGSSLEDQARLAAQAFAGKTQRSEEQARERAAEVIEKLKAGGNIETLVAEYTDDTAAKAAGGAAVIDHTPTFSAEIKKVVFALLPGEISQPLRQPDAFLVVKMEEKSIEPLATVRSAVVQELRSTHLNEWFANVNARFTPQVQAPEFFRQAAPVTPAGPAPPASAK